MYQDVELGNNDVSIGETDIQDVCCFSVTSRGC